MNNVDRSDAFREAGRSLVTDSAFEVIGELEYDAQADRLEAKIESDIDEAHRRWPDEIPESWVSGELYEYEARFWCFTTEEEITTTVKAPNIDAAICRARQVDARFQHGNADLISVFRT